MAKATREDVLSALGRVIDPETGKSLTEAQMVQGLVVKDGNVGFALEVSGARGPQAEPLRQAAADAVSALPGVLSVTAVLTAHQHEPQPRPRTHTVLDRTQDHGGGHNHAGHRQGVHTHSAPKRGAKPHHAPAAAQGIPGVGAIIAVASGKGGVGKSTVAVNLALGLAKLGLKTGLLDADIYGPSVPRLLNITEKPQSDDGKVLKPIERHGIKTMSIGFLVGEDTPMIWRGPMVQSALTQMMNDVAWAPLDVLVLDMPPGTGDAQLTIAQRVPLKGAIIVSTPQDIALIDARKGLAMFRKTQVPILGIVENMSVFICPDCGSEHHIFGHGGARETAAELDAPFLGEIPLVRAIRETSDAGTPIVVSAPDSREAEAFLALAREVAQKIAAPTRAAPKIILE